MSDPVTWLDLLLVLGGWKVGSIVYDVLIGPPFRAWLDRRRSR